MPPLVRRLGRSKAWVSVAGFALIGLAPSLAFANAGPVCQRQRDKTYACWQGKMALPAEHRDAELARVAPPGVTETVTRGSYACGVHRDGGVSCWGDNDAGQLGDGTRRDRATPARVPGLRGVRALALGAASACALHADGGVSCWGGLAGVPAVKPTRVAELAGAVEIAAGAFHACARMADATVRCWGDNRYGQLGDGTQQERDAPVRSSNVTDVIEIAAAGYHSCARRRDGSVWCWGNGWGGEDGTEARLLVPSRVPSILGATSLVAATGVVAAEQRGAITLCKYRIAGLDESSARLACRTATQIPPSAVESLTFVEPRLPAVARPRRRP
jgi:hypothetical protein